MLLFCSLSECHNIKKIVDRSYLQLIFFNGFKLRSASERGVVKLHYMKRSCYITVLFVLIIL